MTSHPLDFTVVGGFLGAGKTTLVNQILAASDTTRFAVLVNDFGALNIDESLIVSQTSKIMKLANGCICCSLAGGLVEAMLTLMQYRDVLDHILIEASGVSYPSRIMDFARIDRDLRPGLTIVLIDAVQFPTQVADTQLAETVQAQIEGADLFLLSKTDIAAPAAIAATRALLQARHAAVPIVEIGPDDDLATFLVFDQAVDTDAPLSGAQTGHAHDVLPHARFASIALQSEAPIDRAAFTAALDAHKAVILRGKGIVWFDEGPAVWQQTGRLMTLEALANASDTPKGRSQLIVISPDNLDALRAAFETLGFVSVSDASA